MIAMTTSNSISVKPPAVGRAGSGAWELRACCLGDPPADRARGRADRGAGPIGWDEDAMDARGRSTAAIGERRTAVGGPSRSARSDARRGPAAGPEGRPGEGRGAAGRDRDGEAGPGQGRGAIRPERMLRPELAGGAGGRAPRRGRRPRGRRRGAGVSSQSPRDSGTASSAPRPWSWTPWASRRGQDIRQRQPPTAPLHGRSALAGLLAPIATPHDRNATSDVKSGMAIRIGPDVKRGSDRGRRGVNEKTARRALSRAGPSSRSPRERGDLTEDSRRRSSADPSRFFRRISRRVIGRRPDRGRRRSPTGSTRPFQRIRPRWWCQTLAEAIAT